VLDAELLESLGWKATEGEYPIVASCTLTEHVELDVFERVAARTTDAVDEREVLKTEIVCPAVESLESDAGLYFSGAGRVDTYDEYLTTLLAY
jgi:hypothetical protein